LPASHKKAMRAVEFCRTKELGGHLDRCDACGFEHPSYNSCRNRHCPKCQSLAKARWLEKQTAELLPVGYFHLVFTLPHELNRLILANKKESLALLFKAASETLLEFGRRRFKGTVGIIAVLHTWDQTLRDHFSSSLSGSCRCAFIGSKPLDQCAAKLPVPGQGSEPGVSWKISRAVMAGPAKRKSRRHGQRNQSLTPKELDRLCEKTFRFAPDRPTRQDPKWIRVAELWDDDMYRQLRRNLDGSRHADRREARFELLRRILDYEIPVVRMVDHSFDDAVKAFTRINTLGVRLKKEDIESAQVAARHSGFIADEVTLFLDRIRKHQGFNRLNVMHLFRACAFVATPDGRNRTPLHELERRDVLAAWKATEKATEQAIGLIRSELGLVNMDILWSGSLVVPLIAVCATRSPRQRDPKELAGWLALAGLCHRYSGSSETALDQDLRACRSQDAVGALLTNLRTVRTSLLAEPKDFAGSLADRSGLLALYVACMNRGVLDFYTGAKVILQSNVDRHHILPRAQFAEEIRSTADNIANMAFIAGDVNKSIGQAGPEVYLAKVKTRVLQSQCIPIDSALWRIDQADVFWQARRELLAESFNEYVREALPQRRI
jgi:hypothetical protein